MTIANPNSKRITLKAAAITKTTTSQYKVASVNASMTAYVASNGSLEIVGIIDSEQSASSEVVSIIYSGLAKGVMRTGTSCVIGALLVSDTIGSLDTLVTGSTAQGVCVGRALSVPITGGTVNVLMGSPIWKTVDIS